MRGVFASSPSATPSVRVDPTPARSAHAARLSSASRKACALRVEPAGEGLCARSSSPSSMARLCVYRGRRAKRRALTSKPFRRPPSLRASTPSSRCGSSCVEPRASEACGPSRRGRRQRPVCGRRSLRECAALFVELAGKGQGTAVEPLSEGRGARRRSPPGASGCGRRDLARRRASAVRLPPAPGDWTLRASRASPAVCFWNPSTRPTVRSRRSSVSARALMSIASRSAPVRDFEQAGEIGLARCERGVQRVGPLVEQSARGGERRLQRIGAVGEAALHRQQPFAETLVDLHHPVGDRLGQLVRADRQLVAERLQAAVERGRHLVVAVVEGGGHLARARDQRLADLARAAVERRVDALQPVVERVGEAVGALREVLRHLADAGGHAVLEAGKPAFDRDLDRAGRGGEADGGRLGAFGQAALEARSGANRASRRSARRGVSISEPSAALRSPSVAASAPPRLSSTSEMRPMFSSIWLRRSLAALRQRRAASARRSWR